MAEVATQLAMDETLLDDKELEDALELREEMRERVRAVREPYREADTIAKGLIEAKVEVGTIARVGRFRVERTETEEKHVEFDTKAGVRVRIAADSDE